MPVFGCSALNCLAESSGAGRTGARSRRSLHEQIRAARAAAAQDDDDSGSDSEIWLVDDDDGADNNGSVDPVGEQDAAAESTSIPGTGHVEPDPSQSSLSDDSDGKVTLPTLVRSLPPSIAVPVVYAAASPPSTAGVSSSSSSSTPAVAAASSAASGPAAAAGSGVTAAQHASAAGAPAPAPKPPRKRRPHFFAKETEEEQLANQKLLAVAFGRAPVGESSGEDSDGGERGSGASTSESDDDEAVEDDEPDQQAASAPSVDAKLRAAEAAVALGKERRRRQLELIEGAGGDDFEAATAAIEAAMRGGRLFSSGREDVRRSWIGGHVTSGAAAAAAAGPLGATAAPGKASSAAGNAAAAGAASGPQGAAAAAPAGTGPAGAVVVAPHATPAAAAPASYADVVVPRIGLAAGGSSAGASAPAPRATRPVDLVGSAHHAIVTLGQRAAATAETLARVRSVQQSALAWLAALEQAGSVHPPAGAEPGEGAMELVVELQEALGARLFDELNALAVPLRPTQEDVPAELISVPLVMRGIVVCRAVDLIVAFAEVMTRTRALEKPRKRVALLAVAPPSDS